MCMELTTTTTKGDNMKRFHGLEIKEEMVCAERPYKFRILSNGSIFMCLIGLGIWREITQTEFNGIRTEFKFQQKQVA